MLLGIGDCELVVRKNMLVVTVVKCKHLMSLSK